VKMRPRGHGDTPSVSYKIEVDRNGTKRGWGGGILLQKKGGKGALGEAALGELVPELLDGEGVGVAGEEAPVPPLPAVPLLPQVHVLRPPHRCAEA